jgi:hypothetical protein
MNLNKHDVIGDIYGHAKVLRNLLRSDQNGSTAMEDLSMSGGLGPTRQTSPLEALTRLVESRVVRHIVDNNNWPT